MKQINIKDIELPDISEEDLNKIVVVDPIDFLTEEQNEELIESIKQRLIDSKNPDRWMTWEEACRRLDEKYFSRNV